MFEESYLCATGAQASPLWRLTASFHPVHSATASLEVTIPVVLIGKLPIDTLLAGIGTLVEMTKKPLFSTGGQRLHLTTLRKEAPVTFRLNREGKLTQANIIELGEVARQAVSKSFGGKDLEPKELYAVHVSHSYVFRGQYAGGTILLDMRVPAGTDKSSLSSVRSYVEHTVQRAGKNFVQFSFNREALGSPGLVGFSCGAPLAVVVAKLDALIASVK